MNGKDWQYQGDDFMEIGDTGLVPIKDGWFYNKNTRESIDPNGVIYNEDGEVVYDPSLENNDYEQPYGDNDYEWYHK